MTKHSESTGQKGSEGDSEQKKWGQKRQQFDAVVSSARFNGAIDSLVNGTVDVASLIALLDELNSVQAQRGRYMAEILALKVESRRLATVPFHRGVAEFLIEGSRRIPWLSDGLASQLAVALASASDNPVYLDTVNTAVSNLLLDVTRPLKPDTRNYLRALTDKVLASRRLQEARGHLAIVPSVYPSAIPQQLEQVKPFETPPASAPSQAAEAPQASTLLATTGAATVGGFEEYERTTLPSGAEPQAGLVFHGAGQDQGCKSVAGHPRVDALQSGAGAALARHERASNAIENQLAASTAATVEIREQRESSPAFQVTPPSGGQHARVLSPEQAVLAGAAAARPSDSVQQAAAPDSTSSGAVLAAGKTAPGIGVAGSIDQPVISSASTTPGVGFTPSVRSVPPAASDSGEEKWDDLDDEDLKADQRPASRRGALGIPVWIIVVTSGALVASAMGLWAFTREHDGNAIDAAADTSAAAPAGSAKNTQLGKRLSGAAASARAAAASAVAKANPPAAVPPPATPPPAAVPATPPPAAVPATPPPAAVPATPPPAAKPAAATPPTPGLAPGGHGRAATNSNPGVAPAAAHGKPSAGTQASGSKPAASKPAAAPTQIQPSTKPATPAPSPKVTAEAPAPDVPGAPRTPTPSRTVDDIIAELRQIPNDGAAIEAKAHEVARIVARSVRKEAEIILQRLIPEEVLVGTETTDTRVLEPVRRVVALLLKKVAVDKDDNRAALAIDTLGEWAKLRKHGAAAKLTLDELAEDRVVLSRPVRLRALERVQSRLGISESGE